MEIKYTSDYIGNIILFENLTKSKVVDSLFVDGALYFVVDDDLGPIIGKDGENIRNLQQKMKKKIKVFRYSKDIEQFTKNLIAAPVNEIKILEKNNYKTINVSMEKSRMSLVIGRGGTNIKIIKEFLKRHFDVNDLKLR